MNNSFGSNSIRQDQMYATDGLIESLREASIQNRESGFTTGQYPKEQLSPEDYYRNFKQRRIQHQNQILTNQQQPSWRGASIQDNSFQPGMP